MKIVLQRVLEAKVEVEGEVVGEIGKGYLALLGVSDEDTEEKADKAIAKMAKLRIFQDDEGKTNLAASDVGGELLVVSQFTLYADCRKGNRPSFIRAGSPDHANKIYEYFIQKSAPYFTKVAHGIFGADMKVSLINDGPFTVILEDGNGI